MNFTRRYIITLIIIILFIPWFTSANENAFKSMLIETDGQPLNEKQISILLSYKPDTVLKTIRDIHKNMNCKTNKCILSQHAILYLGIHGNLEDIKIINSVWECDKAKSTELLPCEYYCAYEFSIDLLNIKFRGKEPPAFKKDDLACFANKETSLLQADSIEYLLKDMNETDLLNSIDDRSLRPKIPDRILEGLSDSQIEYFYKEGVYFVLSKKAKDIKTRDILFKELLYYYFRDASGDGVVNILQKVLLQIEKRRSDLNNIP